VSTIPLFDSSTRDPDATAVVDASGAHSFAQLERRSRRTARELLGGTRDLEEARIGFLLDPGFEYVVTQWAIWRAGGIAVPLSPRHPIPEIEHVLDDSEAGMLIAGDRFDGRLRPLARARELPYRTLSPGREDVAGDVSEEESGLPSLEPARRAMILYTSGTTGRPKGVVSTHASLDAQMRTMVEAWRWTPEDRILHVLPLDHTHGIVNALGCALYCGATVEFTGGRFEAEPVWNRLSSGDVSVFMAVPTIYVKLLKAWEDADDVTRARWSRGVRELRLMVSGSAALPVSVFHRWEEITGHRLLERYGMTEIGMGLSNPYDGERRPGTVGQPLPGVEIRLVGEGASGQIEVRGDMVFAEYWNRPGETEASFVDGWFRTGDEAILESGYYRILGRQSVDILKSGGYKISAIEIEELLRTHPGVEDCAIVGLPDEEWGERVAAAVVIEPGAWFIPDLAPPGSAGTDERSRAAAAVLEPWLRERLADYKVPRAWRTVDALPRNGMGKVQKLTVRALFESAPGAVTQDPKEHP